MSIKLAWKEIPPVPTSQEFLDIVLSRTQRRLPTVIRPGFKISRIRAFYTRKVKYTAETFTEKFASILTSFPRLDDCHPFHRDLLNCLYDADHFRIALGQLSTAKHLVESIARDYVRLIKYAQSLFQCKQLKRAALGRMATLIKRLKDPLVYLDSVRQHLARLPSIDPNTRTLVICGYPNVGKSSFLNNVTRADVAVEPYAFTTKSLFVGHFDYNYLRFQVVDTPGILDHPLEECNVIEMQSITALAHLRAAILYFMDLSEQCGYSVQDQISLYKSIRPLFAKKPVFIIINKIDIMRPEDLDPSLKAELDSLVQSVGVELLTISCNTKEGVQAAKNAACGKLLAERVAQKLKAGQTSSGGPSSRLQEVIKRVHVAQPLNGQTREAFIPEVVKRLQKYDKSDPDRRKLARDVEAENGGPGVFNVDLRKDWLLTKDEWKYDKMPEVLDGQNVADYFDPDIEAKLNALEEDERRLEAEGYYDEDDDMADDDEEEALQKASYIREQHAMIRNEAKMRKSLNKAIMPRKAKKRTFAELEDHLDQLGVDTEEIGLRNQVLARGRSLQRRGDLGASTNGDGDTMDLDVPPMTAQQRLRSKSRVRDRSQPARNRRDDGIADPTARKKADRQARQSQRKMNRMARQGEADRYQAASLSKYLVAGKRGLGKAHHR